MSTAPTAAKSPSETPTSISTVQPQPPKISSRFTQSQLALALAIQKSKPEGIPTNEYCLQLQANIRAGRGTLPANYRHIDTPEFWRDQYSKIYKEKKSLEDRVNRLEEEQRLQGQNDSHDPGDETGLAILKRPAQSEEVEGRVDQEGNSVTPDQDIFLRLSSYVLRISRSRSALDKATKEPSLLEHIEDQFKASVQLLVLLERALSDCSIPLWSIRCGDDAQITVLLQQLMHQWAVSFKSCFNTFNTLCSTIVGRQKRFDIVYRLVMLFEKSLDHLCTVCSIQAENEMVDGRKLRNKRARTVGEYAVNKYMTGMLISIAEIEWRAGQVGQSEILEGILFSILSHTGRLLSNAVFKEHVATSDLAGNITKDGPRMLPEAAKLQSQCIVPVLHAALGKSSARKELIARVLVDPANAGAQRRSQTSSEHTHELLLKARKMIQSSLVASAVGGHGLESLRTLPPPANDPYIPEVDTPVEKYGSEWLLESVWALVGWEMAVQ